MHLGPGNGSIPTQKETFHHHTWQRIPSGPEPPIAVSRDGPGSHGSHRSMVIASTMETAWLCIDNDQRCHKNRAVVYPSTLNLTVIHDIEKPPAAILSAKAMGNK